MRKALREQIAAEAARLLLAGRESEWPRAKRSAARRLGYRFKPHDLPSNHEVREQWRRLEEIVHAESAVPPIRAWSLLALEVMRVLWMYRPRWLGELPTPGSELRGVDVAVFALDPNSVEERLKTLPHLGSPRLARMPEPSVDGSLARLDWPKMNQVRVTVYDPASAERKRISGKATSSLEEVEEALKAQAPGADLEAELVGLDPRSDRFATYSLLLGLLEDVEQSTSAHPEGDALFHSLQVFDLAVLERPCDEEFLSAALLHDVGKSVEGTDHTTHGLELLDGLITRRTRWLIEFLPSGQELAAGRLPAKAKATLERHENFEDLMLLVELDRRGRQPGARTSALEEAVDYLRCLDDESLWQTAEEQKT